MIVGTLLEERRGKAWNSWYYGVYIEYRNENEMDISTVLIESSEHATDFRQI